MTSSRLLDNRSEIFVLPLLSALMLGPELIEVMDERLSEAGYLGTESG